MNENIHQINQPLLTKDICGFFGAGSSLSRRFFHYHYLFKATLAIFLALRHTPVNIKLLVSAMFTTAVTGIGILTYYKTFVKNNYGYTS